MKKQQINEAKTTKRFKTVQQLLYTLNHPKTALQKKRKQVVLDREIIKKSLKSKWRDAGYCNRQFTKPAILRTKILNQWQLQRISLADRSYKYPKKYHGIRFDTFSRQFSNSTQDYYSEQFKIYLQKMKVQYENNQFKEKKFNSSNFQRTTEPLRNGFKFHVSRDTTFGYNFKNTKNHFKKLKTCNV